MNTAVFCGASLPRNKEIVEAAAPVRGEDARMKQLIEQKQ